MMGMQMWRVYAAVAVLASLGIEARAQRPAVLGTAITRIEYQGASGPRKLEGVFDFRGLGPRDALPFPQDEKVLAMNSVNAFGRRPLVRDTIKDDEILITNAIFKADLHENDFLADIASEDTIVTFIIEDVKFDRPVFFQADTFMFHKLWDIDQVDRLPNPYIQVHNQDTATDPFRDFEAFRGLIFHEIPQDYRLGYVTEIGELHIHGDGSDTLTIHLDVPYRILKHMEEQGQQVPPGLPAPFGYLEPWHFHMEYCVSSGSGNQNTCTYELKKSKSKGCHECPAPGTLYPTEVACQSEDECERKIKTRIDCPHGGGACILKGKRHGCE